MSGTGISLLDGLTAQMKHLERRQGVISENIASADTPGYRARDVDKPDFSDILGSVDDGRQIAKPRVGATSRMRELGSRVSIGGAGVHEIQGTEEKMNGNNVTIEDEILKLGQIRMEHAEASNLYKKSLRLMKLSLGKGG